MNIVLLTLFEIFSISLKRANHNSNIDKHNTCSARCLWDNLAGKTWGLHAKNISHFCRATSPWGCPQEGCWGIECHIIYRFRKTWTKLYKIMASFFFKIRRYYRATCLQPTPKFELVILEKGKVFKIRARLYKIVWNVYKITASFLFWNLKMVGLGAWTFKTFPQCFGDLLTFS